MGILRKHSDWVAKAHFEDVEFLSEYQGQNKYIKFKCATCGKEVSRKAQILEKTRKVNCNACGNINKKHEEWVAKNHLEDIKFSHGSVYTGDKEEVLFMCRECGIMTRDLAYKVARDPRCRPCMKKSANPVMPHKEWVELHNLQDIRFMTEYEGPGTLIRLYCCGSNERPNCKVRLRKSVKDVENRESLCCNVCQAYRMGFNNTQDAWHETHKKALEGIEFITRYVNSKTKLKFRCTDCGAIIEKRGDSIIAGYTRCDECGEKKRKERLKRYFNNM